MIQVATNLFPKHADLMFYLGAGIAGAAIVGLAILFFWPRIAPPTDRLGIDQSVSSHNQSGGITAHTVNIGSQQRRILGDQKNVMVEVLAAHQGASAKISVESSSDGAALAMDFVNIFSEAGWQVSRAQSVSGGNGPSSGITWWIKDPDNLTPPQQAAYKALELSGLDFYIAKGGTPPPFSIDVDLVLTQRH